MVHRELVTTAFDLDGFKITKNLGIVRGITLRKCNVFGGNITKFTKLCEKAREEAYDIMIHHANDVGANAIIGMRYDTNAVKPGAAEILCYGTAVVTEPNQNSK